MLDLDGPLYNFRGHRLELMFNFFLIFATEDCFYPNKHCGVERCGSVGRALDWGLKGCWKQLCCVLEQDTIHCLVLVQP